MSNDIELNHAYEAMNRAAATEDGRILMRVVLQQCGYDKNAMSDTDATMTQLLAAERGIYMKLRKRFKDEHLKAIEFDYKIVADKPVEVETKKTKRVTKRGKK